LARFKELGQYKQSIVLKLIQSQEICKAIHYQQENFLDLDDIDDPTALIYKNIFPHSFVPTVTDQAKTYLAVHFSRFRNINGSFKSGIIYVSVFSHRTLFKTDYGTTRIDFLLNKIDESLNEYRGIGIGKLEFYEMDEFTVHNANTYSGAYIAYKPVDFN
jgi:hypothetical protein